MFKQKKKINWLLVILIVLVIAGLAWEGQYFTKKIKAKAKTKPAPQASISTSPSTVPTESTLDSLPPIDPNAPPDQKLNDIYGRTD